MRHVIFAALVAMPLPALAEQCNHWTAAMEDDEGGSVMTAGICAPAGKDTVYLSITCGDPGKLSIRFLPAPTDGFPPTPNFKSEIEFSLDQESFKRPAQYEEMDGALVVDTPIDAPFIGVLQSQKEVQVSETGGKLPSATFPLKGSRGALQKLTATCARK